MLSISDLHTYPYRMSCLYKCAAIEGDTLLICALGIVSKEYREAAAEEGCGDDGDWYLAFTLVTPMSSQVWK